MTKPSCHRRDKNDDHDDNGTNKNNRNFINPIRNNQTKIKEEIITNTVSFYQKNGNENGS